MNKQKSNNLNIFVLPQFEFIAKHPIYLFANSIRYKKIPHTL